MSRKVGIIGSGIVGQTLANGFIKHGYAVTIGTNTPAKREELTSKTNGHATVGSFDDAARQNFAQCVERSCHFQGTR